MRNALRRSLAWLRLLALAALFPERYAHVWRRVEQIWIVGFTIAVIILFRNSDHNAAQNKQSIVELQRTKASIGALQQQNTVLKEQNAGLQKTDCVLRKFLNDAAKARAASATRDKARGDLKQYRIDRAAAKSYSKFADIFFCHE